MPEILVDRYRRWFEYEQNAQRMTLDSLRGVAGDRQGSDEWQRAVKLFAHLIVTRQVWLARITGAKEPNDYFPEGRTLDELAAMTEVMRIAWAEYLAQLSDADLTRIYEYRRSDGRAFRNSVEDTLAHLFGHSFYHRGQIAALVRAMGGQPAATDYIFSVREELTGGPG